MSERRGQRTIRRENVFFGAGGALLVAGALLVVLSFVDDTSASRDPDPAPVASPTPDSTTTTSAPPEARSFTLAATGELLMSDAVNAQAAESGAFWGADYDFRPMFEQVTPMLSRADIALCHLENPLAPTPDDVSGGDKYVAPKELAEAIRDAGYEGCSTASDHALDGDEEAVRATLDTFDSLSLGHTGTARTSEEAILPRGYDTQGVRVAHLAYAYPDDLELPDGAEYTVATIDADRIVDEAAGARRAGAQVVVVSLHWGDRFESEPTDAQVELAERLSESPDIDLVIGHHAHVVQPITRVGDLVVAYGLGNFLTNQSQGECCPAASQDGVIVRFRFTETGPGTNEFTVDDITYTATIVDRDTFHILPVEETLTDPELTSGERGAFERSRDRTAEAIGELAHTAP